MLLGEYECTSLIGAGTFATVLLGRQKVTNTPVAIKKIPRNNFNDPDAENRFERECNLIREMDHPFIAEFYDVIQDDKNYYIIMEYVENGNMLDYVNKNGELQEIQVRHYFCQLISVLEYLHEVKKVAHRDLKAENVLLDTHYNIRLIDFGLSNLYTDENPYLKTACGSPAYASPEMIRGNHYTIASDIWSAGILLYAMCVGELPFEDDNMQRLFQKITFKEPNYPTTISPALKDLLCRLLTKNPNDRITLQKIKEHPWFSQYQYSQMMDMNFGIVCDWRIIGGNTDRDIIQIMNNHGYECTHLVNDLFDNKTNNLTAVYRMLRKSKISDEMRDVSLSSLLHSKRLHKVNTILNQFAKTTVKPIPKPIITDCKIQRPTQDFSKSPVSNKLSLCRQDSADVTKSTPMYNLRTRSINLPKHGEISKLIAKPYSSNFLQQRRRSSSMREPSPLIPTANPV